MEVDSQIPAEEKMPVDAREYYNIDCLDPQTLRPKESGKRRQIQIKESKTDMEEKEFGGRA
ncbi:MAG: hypothetical protein ACLRVB_08800 [Blautia sp.]